MRRILLLGSILVLSSLALGQNFTAVTGTVLDPNGIPYAFGNITFTLGPLPFSSAPTLPTTPPTPVAITLGPIGLSASGAFAANVPSNAAITPGSTQWTPTVCVPQGAGHQDFPQAPLGTCFTASAITISGGSQDISTTLQAAATQLVARVNTARLYNTLPAAGTSSIGPTTMLTVPATPAAGTTYRFAAYVSQTVLGASCAGNSTIAVNVITQDPNAASPQTTVAATFTVTTNGTLGIVPITAELQNPFTFRAKPGATVGFSTTFTPGGSCSPAPTVQVYPVLEQM